MKTFLPDLLFVSLALMVSCHRHEPDVQPVIPEGAVDLGIVMTREDGSTYNLYWAESNLSESGLCPAPEDFGDYYAWGELEPYYAKGHSMDKPCKEWRNGYDGYYWTSYKFFAEGIIDAKVTRYCSGDRTDYWGGKGSPGNIMELSGYDYADDAARATLHGKWRIPTRQEWAALREQCTWTYEVKEGVNGYRVTGKNGNSLYIPEGGFRENDTIREVGETGNYWTATADTEYPSYAWYCFLKESVYQGDYRSSRYYGQSIRPVSE